MTSDRKLGGTFIWRMEQIMMFLEERLQLNVRTRQPQLEYRLFDDVLGGEALTEGKNKTTPTGV